MSNKPAKKRKSNLTATAGTSSSVPCPDVVDLVEPDNAQELANKFLFYNGGHDWVGFKRSEKAKNRHYRAQCEYCHVELDGRLDVLQKHKQGCSEMPEEIRKTAPTKATISARGARNKSIVEMFTASDRSQDDSDYLLAMALITGDIPSR